MAFDDEKIHEEELTEHSGGSPHETNPLADPKPRSTRKSVFRLLTNKYLITLLAFAVWIVFFDNNNLIFRKRVKSEIRQMELQREYYLEEIKMNMDLRELLTNDLDAIEAFGREQYLMKRPNEDIYLIIEDQ